MPDSVARNGLRWTDQDGTDSARRRAQEPAPGRLERTVVSMSGERHLVTTSDLDAMSPDQRAATVGSHIVMDLAERPMHATGIDVADLDDDLPLLTVPEAAQFLSVSRSTFGGIASSLFASRPRWPSISPPTRLPTHALVTSPNTSPGPVNSPPRALAIVTTGIERCR
jgi:hypothetical protein